MKLFIIATLLFSALASPINENSKEIKEELTTPKGNDEHEGTKMKKMTDEVGAEGKALHIYTDDVPKIDYFANKYYITLPSRRQQQQDKKKKEKERRPYNQVNVYVYFDNSTMMNDKMMVMTDSDMHGGSTTIEEEDEEEKLNTLPRCGPEQAIINGVCIGYGA